MKTCYPLTKPGSWSIQTSDQGLFGMQIRPAVSWSETARTGPVPFFSKENSSSGQKKNAFHDILDVLFDGKAFIIVVSSDSVRLAMLILLTIINWYIRLFQKPAPGRGWFGSYRSVIRPHNLHYIYIWNICSVYSITAGEKKGCDRYDPHKFLTYTQRPGIHRGIRPAQNPLHRFDVRLQEEAQRKEVNKRPLISTNILVPIFETNCFMQHIRQLPPRYAESAEETARGKFRTRARPTRHHGKTI